MQTTNSKELLTRAKTTAINLNQYEDINENTIEIDFTANAIKRGKLNLSYETIEASANILANKLIDYARSGGDMKNLTPSNVFGNRKGKTV